LFEAQQAHYYGLSSELSLASITTTPAKAAGLSHRVGFLSKGEITVIVFDV
jgi:imidazolonepropionase-like amidohydrolase